MLPAEGAEAQGGVLDTAGGGCQGSTSGPRASTWAGALATSRGPSCCRCTPCQPGPPPLLQLLLYSQTQTFPPCWKPVEPASRRKQTAARRLQLSGLLLLLCCLVLLVHCVREEALVG